MILLLVLLCVNPPKATFLGSEAWLQAAGMLTAILNSTLLLLQCFDVKNGKGYFMVLLWGN